MTRDRGVKLDAYMQSTTLRQIVLVYPGEVRVESWAREPGEPWSDEPQVLTAAGASLSVPLIEAHLALASVYEGVDGDR
jgi:hypothetical protein